MKRFEESSKHDYDRRVKLGKKNAECIKNMRLWCKHFQIEQTSSGLYAEMSGLPIGSHKIECPHAFGSESMNLPRICEEFLVENCDKCEHHAPNGEISWARDIIDKRHDYAQKQAQESQDRQEKIEKLRTSLQKKVHSTNEYIEQDSKRIIQFLDHLISEDVTKQEESAEYLKQSACLAPDLFSDAAIELILALAATDEFSEKIFPVCRELGKRRIDLHSRLQKVSIDCIKRESHVEAAASVIESLGDSVEYPLDDNVIESLLLSQDHIHPLGGWRGKKPNYSSTTTLLVSCIDSNSESLKKITRQYLQHESDYIRIQLCGAIRLIQELRPIFILDLLEDLMNSLELYEVDSLNETPSGCLVNLFQTAFRVSPEKVDLFLGDAIYRVRPTVQEDIIRVYRDQFFDRELEWSERRNLNQRDEVSPSELIGIRRLLNWLKDNSLDLDIRTEVVDALQIAAEYATGALLAEFDSLLGFYALILEEEGPPDRPPKIIIPGQAIDPILEQLKNANHNDNWAKLKYGLGKCLEEICKARPREVLDSIIGCLNQPHARLGEEFKGTLVTMLGKIGQEYELRPLALPLIMRALMDYSSTLVRAKAIRATSEMFSYSHIAPPANLVEMIVIHLRDTKIKVHQAATDAVSRHPEWFSDNQAHEVLECLSVHLNAYKNDLFQIKDICEAILSIGHRNDVFKLNSIRLIISVFPTGEELVDTDIANYLMHFCKPDERLATIVSRSLALYLGLYKRDRYNHHRYSTRNQMIEWLIQIPPAIYQHLREKLLESAKKIAALDTWESLHFANLFSLFGDFQLEKEILEIASNSISDSPRHNEFKKKIDKLAEIANENSALL